MAKTTSNNKKQPEKVESLRETIAKTTIIEETEVSEEPRAEELKAEDLKAEKIKNHSAKHEKKEVVKETTGSQVDDLTGALENHKTRKKPLMTALIALLAIAVVVGLTFWFLYLRANQPTDQDEAEQPNNSQIEPQEPEDSDDVVVVEEVDYMQDIKNANGVALEPVYYLGTKENFTLVFTKLLCDETCSNIGDVKINGTLLVSGQDYIVKREEGVTLVVYAAALNKYEAGDKELTFQILQTSDERKELRTIGVKFELKKAVVCGAGQVAKGDKCQAEDVPEKQPEEKPVDSAQAQCAAQEGPDYVYRVHWYTEAEKQAVIKDYGYDDGVIVRVVRGDFIGEKNGSTSANMVWANNSCRPNPNATAVIAGEKSYTEANLSSIDASFAALVKGNPQQDIVVYAWRTNDGVRYQMELAQ